MTPLRICALLLALLPAALPAATALGARARLEAYLDDAHTWQAAFEQTVLDDDGHVLEVADGRVYVARPGRFRWDYLTPYEQSIITDGRTLWIYDQDLEQITRRPVDGSLERTPAALLGERFDLDSRFTVTEMPDDGALAWVALAPREDDEQYQRIRVGFDGDTLVQMQLADSLGQVTVLRFTDIERNSAVDPGLFEFVPPPGVDIIDTGDDAGTQAP